MVYIKQIEIDRGRTIKLTQRIGKKSVDTWDKIGVSIRWAFKESENPEDFHTWINEMKKKLDNMIEIYSSRYFNEYNNTSIDKKNRK